MPPSNTTPTFTLEASRASVVVDHLYFDPASNRLIPGSLADEYNKPLLPLSDKSKFTPEQITTIDQLARNLDMKDPYARITQQQAIDVVQKTLAGLPKNDPMRPVIEVALQSGVEIRVIPHENANAFSGKNFHIRKNSAPLEFTTQAFATTNGKKIIYIPASADPARTSFLVAHELQHIGEQIIYQNRANPYPAEGGVDPTTGKRRIFSAPKSTRQQLFEALVADAIDGIAKDHKLTRQQATQEFFKGIQSDPYAPEVVAAEVPVRIADIIRQGEWGKNPSIEKYLGGLRKFNEQTARDAVHILEKPGVPLPEINVEAIRPGGLPHVTVPLEQIHPNGGIGRRLTGANNHAKAGQVGGVLTGVMGGVQLVNGIKQGDGLDGFLGAGNLVAGATMIGANTPLIGQAVARSGIGQKLLNAGITGGRVNEWANVGGIGFATASIVYNASKEQGTGKDDRLYYQAARATVDGAGFAAGWRSGAVASSLSGSYGWIVGPAAGLAVGVGTSIIGNYVIDRSKEETLEKKAKLATKTQQDHSGGTHPIANDIVVSVKPAKEGNIISSNPDRAKQGAIVVAASNDYGPTKDGISGGLSVINTQRQAVPIQNSDSSKGRI